MHLKSSLLSSLALLAVAPVLAKDIEGFSRIDAVTLFPDAAQPTRVVEVDLPAGASRVVLARLPVDVDQQNFQVSGNGDFAVGAIETEVEEAAQPDRAFNDPVIRKLQDQIAELDSGLEVVAEKQRMAKVYGAGQPEVWAKHDKSNDPEFQKKVWSLVADTLSTTEERPHALRREQRPLHRTAGADDGADGKGHGRTARRPGVAF